MIDAHKQAFVEEAKELLSELESTLLELEDKPSDTDLIAKVFRALHTIKGSSAMFGYDEIAAFTHDIESVYDHIRKGNIEITKEIIDLTLAARDQISSMLLPSEKKEPLDENLAAEILRSFKSFVDKIMPERKNGKTVQTEKSKQEATVDAVVKIYRIIFGPAPEIFATGTNPLMLLKELQSLGESIVLAKCENVPVVEEIDAEKCYLSWEIILKSSCSIDDIKDIFIFVEDQCALQIDKIDNDGKLLESVDFQNFKKLVLETAAEKYPDVQKILSSFKPLLAPVPQIKQVEKENKKIKHSQGADSSSSIRVSAEKLDELVNLVGELVTIHARLNQVAQNNNDPAIVSVAEEVERITWPLRDSIMNMRMLPIGTTFSKFKRLVRDLSAELGKEVELITDGAETELDKTVIDKLNDPLIHIIRNSMDHGIEFPAEREASGKTRVGRIELSASHSGGNVLIKISDDGKGIDKDAIKEKAVKMGLVSDSAELTDSEIYSLIFAPGFSTANIVTNVSGRGVGMDVVRKAIEGLRGTIEVKSSKGTGTSIVLRLPLTLAIIDGLLVKIADDHFILPLTAVEECIELRQTNLEQSHGRQLVNIRGGIVPYINLRNKFQITNNKPIIEQIVIAHVNGNRVGFVVDSVLGQHQTVLKSLGRFYKNVRGISGATILGDGTVALILDIQKIIENEEIEEKLSCSN